MDAVPMSIITSRQNPKVKQIRALRQRKSPSKQELFVIEGIRHVGEAAEAGLQIEYVMYAPDLLTSEFAYTLIHRLSDQGVPCYRTTGEIFAAFAEKDHPQGLIGVAHKRKYLLSDLNPNNFNWGVALVSPQDPGNVGTILRTIDGVGSSGLLLLENSVDEYHPTAIRASMGSLFWKPIVRATFADFSSWVHKFGYKIYGSSAQGDVDFREQENYQLPAILLSGSEREGLSKNQASICHKLLRLSMKGRATSLNLAVAVGILLYDMRAKLVSL
jgi:TrmH family RNA methyltransferase